MKLRLFRNSVRLRLSQTDVTNFIGAGVVTDLIQFGPGLCFSYGLQASPSVDRVQATYSPGCLRILVPMPLAEEWTSSDLVGLNSDRGSPSVLVEKDFRCLHREPRGR